MLGLGQMLTIEDVFTGFLTFPLSCMMRQRHLVAVRLVAVRLVAGKETVSGEEYDRNSDERFPCRIIPNVYKWASVQLAPPLI